MQKLSGLLESAVHHQRITLVLLLVSGLLLRLSGVYWGQGYHHFMINDEVLAYEYALAYLAGEPWAQYLAQPFFSGGHLPGPLWTWLCLALLKLGGNTAEGALYSMAVLNTVTIYLVYRLAHKLLTPGYALLTAGLYALAPWTVYYSFGLYNPVPLDLLGAALLLALVNVMQQSNSRQIFWVMLLSAMLPQFHMIGVFFMPAILWLLWLGPVKLNRGWMSAGILAGVAIYLPYLLGEIASDWQNLRAIAAGDGTDNGFSFSVFKIITAPVTVLSVMPSGWPGDSVEAVKQFGDRMFGNWWVLAIIGAWSLAHGFVYLGSFLKRLFLILRNNWRRPRQAFTTSPAVMFIGGMTVLPLGLFMLTGHNFSTRYALLIFPLIFMLPALFLQGRVSVQARSYWYGSVALLILFGVIMTGSYFAYQSQRFEYATDFMPSFRVLDNIESHLLADAGNQAVLRVELGESLRQLPHFEFKLVKTVPQYIQIHQRYRRPQGASEETVSYRIERLTDSSAVQQAVYAHNGILIQRINNKLLMQ